MSRRLGVFAELCLYRRIRLTPSWLVTRGSSAKLLNAFQDRPCRYELVKDLDIDQAASSVDQNHESRSLLRALFKECLNIKRLRFWGHYNITSVDSIFRLPALARLETLEINVAIVKDLNMPGRLTTLNKLSIYQDIWAECEGSSAYEGSQWEDFNLSTGRQAISPLKHLVVGYCDSHPCVLMPILQWPAGLDTLRLNLLVIRIPIWRAFLSCVYSTCSTLLPTVSK